MGRVAEQRQPLGPETAGDAEGERVGPQIRFERDPSELQAEAALDFGQRPLPVERQEVGHSLGALRPDDRGTVAERPAGRERQHGEGTGRQEMLDGAALVVTLVGDGRHDARLRVGPADPADAGLLSQSRARAVGGDEKSRLGSGSVGALDTDDFGPEHEAAHADRMQAHAGGAAGVQQRRRERAALDHMGERFARLDRALEGQERRSHRVG